MPSCDGRKAVAFSQGLSEAGYVEGQNLSIEYRWAEGHYDRLPALAADLVGRKVDLIIATSPPCALSWIERNRIPVVIRKLNEHGRLRVEEHLTSMFLGSHSECLTPSAYLLRLVSYHSSEQGGTHARPPACCITDLRRIFLLQIAGPFPDVVNSPSEAAPDEQRSESIRSSK
jgi:hypothetical protein